MQVQLYRALGVIIEVVGSDTVVLVPGSSKVFRLSGELAFIASNLQTGSSFDVSTTDAQKLVDWGIATQEFAPTRRSLLRAGGLGLGAGVALVTLPGVAAASSTLAQCEPGMPADSNGTPIFFNEPAGSTTFQVFFGAPAPLQVSALRLVVDGTVYTTGNAIVTGPIGGSYDISWVLTGVAVTGNSEVCANFTADGVRYLVQEFEEASG